MTTTKHTPGPWEWYWRVEEGEASCGVFWEKHPGHVYSVCRAPRYQTKEQWKEDASLIAAAPDLFAVAERAETIARSIGLLAVTGRLANLLPAEAIADLEALHRDAEAAIAKARGGK